MSMRSAYVGERTERDGTMVRSSTDGGGGQSNALAHALAYKMLYEKQVASRNMLTAISRLRTINLQLQQKVRDRMISPMHVPLQSQCQPWTLLLDQIQQQQRNHLALMGLPLAQQQQQQQQHPSAGLVLHSVLAPTGGASALSYFNRHLPPANNVLTSPLPTTTNLPHNDAELSKESATSSRKRACNGSIKKEKGVVAKELVLSSSKSERQSLDKNSSNSNSSSNNKKRRTETTGDGVSNTCVVEPTPKRRVLVALNSDENVLTRYQCLVRRQVYFFEVTIDDLQRSARGRNKPIVEGQVGILCKHCADVSPKDRRVGSCYFPAKLCNIYQSVQNMVMNHFLDGCDCIPAEEREQIRQWKEKKQTYWGGGRQYWMDGAKMCRVIERDDYLAFAENKDDCDTEINKKKNNNTGSSIG